MALKWPKMALKWPVMVTNAAIGYSCVPVNGIITIGHQSYCLNRTIIRFQWTLDNMKTRHSQDFP